MLVVDDSRTNRDILCRVLRAQGYRAAAAEDGARALALVAKGRFDAILLDVNMPGISGMGVLAALRGLRSAAELPVLMVTTQAGGEDIADSLRRGANDHVTKPIDFDVMMARLETQLALKRSREELTRLASELARQRELIRTTFGRYLSDDVVASLLATPEARRLGGEEREVTILMTDLRSFTTMTENMPPNMVMDLLNGYLGAMAEIIVGRGGTIVEFIGDAILAVFGAPTSSPDDARRAVTCALEMQLAMDDVNERSAAVGLPPLEMAIAVNTGRVVVGNIGSEARTKYGVVGSQINLTARIESCCVGRQILISESTRAAAGPGLSLGPRHELSVKGFQSRVIVHDLLGAGDLALPERRASLRALGWHLRITCAPVVGKRTDGEPRDARMVALAHTGATLRMAPRPEVFTTLQIGLPGTLGDQLGGDLFAKVVALDADAPDMFQVCFTSAPPGLAAVVRRLCAEM
ncbi:MAG: adenylate/guanylate cyclase domain-containing protein [Minicystis sp.]